MTAAEFYAGLERRFPVRDGMYFLPEQAEEYERFRMTFRELASQTLFIRDESSAVQWLRQLLKDRPRSFADIQPAFMRELQSGIASWEELPELRDMLEANFVDDGAGRWMVPDPKRVRASRPAPHPGAVARVRLIWDRQGPADEVPLRGGAGRVQAGVGRQGVRHDPRGRASAAVGRPRGGLGAAALLPQRRASRGVALVVERRWAWLPIGGRTRGGAGPRRAVGSPDGRRLSFLRRSVVCGSLPMRWSHSGVRKWSEAEVIWRAAATRALGLAAEGEPLVAALASVRLLPHQISTLERALGMNPVRLAICDEVGLGKTITAGAIFAEMKARGRARRAVVVAPKGVQLQWVAEMANRFGEEFVRVGPEGDAGGLRAWIRGGPSIGWSAGWMPSSRCVSRAGWSPEQVEAYNAARFRAVVDAGWDMVIIDEAHHVAGSSDDVARYRLAVELAAATPHVLLLSATPHSGKSDGFRRFLGLLDDGFVRGWPVQRATGRSPCGPNRETTGGGPCRACAVPAARDDRCGWRPTPTGRSNASCTRRSPSTYATAGTRPRWHGRRSAGFLVLADAAPRWRRARRQSSTRSGEALGRCSASVARSVERCS